MTKERNTKPPEIRKPELIEIALHQFLERGYAGTSLRSITGEAGGGTGMFYHYFKDKNEIYEAALGLYNDKYLESIRLVMAQDELSFEEKLDRIFLNLGNVIPEYRQMHHDTLNPDMMVVIMNRTLSSLAKILQPSIIAYLTARGIYLSEHECRYISRFLLYGLSAVIHTPDDQLLSDRATEGKKLFMTLLQQPVPSPQM